MGLLDTLQSTFSGIQSYAQQNIVAPVSSAVSNTFNAATSLIAGQTSQNQAIQQQQQAQFQVQQAQAQAQQQQNQQVQQVQEQIAPTPQNPSVLSRIQSGMKSINPSQSFGERFSRFGGNVVTGTSNIFQMANEEATKSIDAISQPQVAKGIEKGVVGVVAGVPQSVASVMLAPQKLASDITSSQKYWDSTKQKPVSKAEYEMGRTARETPTVLASPITDIKQSNSMEEAFGKSLVYTGATLLGARELPSARTLRTAGITTPSEAAMATGRVMLGIKQPEPILEGAQTPLKAVKEPIMGKEYNVLKGIREHAIAQEIPEASVSKNIQIAKTQTEKMFGGGESGISDINIGGKVEKRARAYPVFEKVPASELSEADILGAVKGSKLKVGVEYARTDLMSGELLGQSKQSKGFGVVELERKPTPKGATQPSPWEVTKTELFGKPEEISISPEVTSYGMIRTPENLFIGTKGFPQSMPFEVTTFESFMRMKPTSIIKPQIEVTPISPMKGTAAARRLTRFEPETTKEKMFGASEGEIWAKGFKKDVSEPFQKKAAEVKRIASEEKARIEANKDLLSIKLPEEGTTKTKTRTASQTAVSTMEQPKTRGRARAKVIIEEEVQTGTRTKFEPPANLEQMNKQFQERVGLRKQSLGDFTSKISKLTPSLLTFTGLKTGTGTKQIKSQLTSFKQRQDQDQNVVLKSINDVSKGTRTRTTTTPKTFQTTPEKEITTPRERTIIGVPTTQIEVPTPKYPDMFPSINPPTNKPPYEPIPKIPPIFGAGGGLLVGAPSGMFGFSGKRLKIYAIPSPEQLMGFGTSKIKNKSILEFD